MRPDLLYDVAIVGGGPAGAASGTTLARKGFKTIILEKEKFPRFSIGESLLPHGNTILKDLGVWPALEREGFLRKYGAEFCTGDKTRLQRFWFSENLKPEFEYSYQVERSRFDQLLLENARVHGCEVREETVVERLQNADRDPMTLTCSGPGGTFELNCRWLIDASGRSSFAGRHLGMKKSQTLKQRRVAIYGHFEGVIRNGGKAEGHITIVRTPMAWFWLIPLAGRRTSVGLVLPADRVAGKNIGEVFKNAVESTPQMKDRMAAAVPAFDLGAIGDYSWKHSTFATRRILLTGDAAGFVDPVFSSGVMLALKSGVQAATLAARAISAGRSLGMMERMLYTRKVSRWMRHYTRIIESFYDRAGFEVFMNPAPVLEIPGSIARLVAGDAQPSVPDRIRMEAFRMICRLQRILPIAPVIPSLR